MTDILSNGKASISSLQSIPHDPQNCTEISRRILGFTPRALYLDHTRTQVCQLTCGKGGRHRLLKGDHGNTFKWEHQYDLGKPRVCSAR